MLVSSLEYGYCLIVIAGNATCEEVAASTETEFSRAERIFRCTKGTRLRDEPTRTSWGVLPLRETIDAVVQQNHIQVDIASHGMDEVVTTDGKSVTIARYLPNGKVRIGYLCTRRDGCGTTMNGLHGVGISVIG